MKAYKDIDNAIIIINKTRLERLNERFNTKAQAKFYIEHSGGSFADYELEHNVFKRALEKVQLKLSKQIKYKVVERGFLPNFIFKESDLIIVLGQDGLVANTAKYVNNQPIIAINPDPKRFDGILLPFCTENFEKAIEATIERKSYIQPVTMAEAKLNDGQRLLAFNDFFIGPSSHISARYRITYNQKSENQSSSGIIVSTGAGSTGWLSSLFNMANGISSAFQKKQSSNARINLKWDASKLVFVVREPFLSKYSKINITAGLITPQNKLNLESHMPAHGVIFSDGIEKDYITFNSGSIAKIGIAEQKAMIVQNEERIMRKK